MAAAVRARREREQAAAAAPLAPDEEVACTGERTRQERDEQLRRDAVDVEAE